MVSAVKCSLAVAVMICLAYSGYAINCYECDSFITPKCALKIEEDESLLTECSYIFSSKPLSPTGCMKIKVKSVAGTAGIVRRCYYGNATGIHNGCDEDIMYPIVEKMSCEVCTTDKCNGF